MDLPRFRHPFASIISGPTGSGKTNWLFNFIKNITILVDKPPDRIVYFYFHWQKAFEDISDRVCFIKGPPEDLESLAREGGADSSKLFIIDDCMSEMGGKAGDGMTTMFSRGCHHLNTSLIVVAQNIFYKGQRTSRINCHYIILMKSVGDKLQAMALARQLYPGVHQFFLQAYRDATQEPFTYLVIDLHMLTQEKMRLRTNIFPQEWPIVVYCPSAETAAKVFK